jgi:hypothetical protein
MSMPTERIVTPAGAARAPPSSPASDPASVSASASTGSMTAIVIGIEFLLDDVLSWSGNPLMPSNLVKGFSHGTRPRA